MVTDNCGEIRERSLGLVAATSAAKKLANAEGMTFYVHEEEPDVLADDYEPEPGLAIEPDAAAQVPMAPEAVQAPKAPQVVQVLAAHLEAQGVTDLRYIRYTPRSGAARRAIAEGADPVPLLMDTDEYGVFSVAPIRHALVGPPATEETVRAQYDLDPAEALALTTTLGMRSGMVRHLVMLDFSEPLAEEATRLLISAITQAGWSGYLLASGASYHFLGSDALELGEWHRQMSFAMLTPGLEGRNAIDVRYMAHTLFNNRGGLRITRGAQKGMVPHLLASFGSAPAVGGGAR